MPGTADFMITVSFVEDSVSKQIHAFMKSPGFMNDVLCEQKPTVGGEWVTLAVDAIQEEWFDRLCPVCFTPDEQEYPPRDGAGDSQC